MVSEKKINPLRLLNNSFASIFDQAILSGLNLIIGLLLIRFIPKNDYGIYTQLYVLSISVTVLYEAFVTNPMVTIAPTLDLQQRQQLYKDIYLIQRYANIALAFLFSFFISFLLVLNKNIEHPWLLGIIFGLFLYYNAQREFQRSTAFLENHLTSVLKIDSLYFVLVLIGMISLYSIEKINIYTVFFTFLAANFIGVYCHPVRFTSQHKTKNYRNTIMLLWKRAKWALPGATLAWFSNYSYLFISAAILGAFSVAELNASKLLLMPIVLGVIAWSRIAKPIATKLIHHKNWQEFKKLNLLSIMTIELLVLMYIALLWLILPWLQTHLLGTEYHHTNLLVLVWSIYFVLFAFRNIGSAWLTSYDQYKGLFKCDVLSISIILICTPVFILTQGASGAIYALIAAETGNIIIIWGLLIPKEKNTRINNRLE